MDDERRWMDNFFGRIFFVADLFDQWLEGLFNRMVGRDGAKKVFVAEVVSY